MFGSLIVFAVYFSGKEGDEGSSKDTLLLVLPLTLSGVVLSIAVLSIVTIFMCRKGKRIFIRKKGNFIIEVQYVIFILWFY